MFVSSILFCRGVLFEDEYNRSDDFFSVKISKEEVSNSTSSGESESEIFETILNSVQENKFLVCFFTLLVSTIIHHIYIPEKVVDLRALVRDKSTVFKSQLSNLLVLITLTLIEDTVSLEIIHFGVELTDNYADKIFNSLEMFMVGLTERNPDFSFNSWFHESTYFAYHILTLCLLETSSKNNRSTRLEIDLVHIIVQLLFSKDDIFVQLLRILKIFELPELNEFILFSSLRSKVFSELFIIFDKLNSALHCAESIIELLPTLPNNHQYTCCLLKTAKYICNIYDFVFSVFMISLYRVNEMLDSLQKNTDSEVVARFPSIKLTNAESLLISQIDATNGQDFVMDWTKHIRSLLAETEILSSSILKDGYVEKIKNMFKQILANRSIKNFI